MSDKNAIRAAIFAGGHFKSKVIPFFGTEIEIRQPSVGQLLNIQNLDKNKDKLAIAQLLIDYAYVPETSDKVFSQADYDSLVELPAGKWVGDMFQTFTELTGGNAVATEKKFEVTQQDK